MTEQRIFELDPMTVDYLASESSRASYSESEIVEFAVGILATLRKTPEGQAHLLYMAPGSSIAELEFHSVLLDHTGSNTHLTDPVSIDLLKPPGRKRQAGRAALRLIVSPDVTTPEPSSDDSDTGLQND